MLTELYVADAVVANANGFVGVDLRCSANIVDNLGGVPFICEGMEVEPYLERPYKELTVM